MKITPIAVAVAAAMFSLSAAAGGDKQHSQSDAQKPGTEAQSGAAGSTAPSASGGVSASGSASASEPSKGASASASASTKAQNPELVKQAQTKLNVTADGKMGPQTQKAVKEFQAAKGLNASGQLDQKTIAALGVSGGESASAGGSAAPKTQGQSPSGAVISPERTAEPKGQAPAK